MMKAFIVDRYGNKNGLRAGEMPDPELREDDVLVQIHAAGVNLLDSKIRNGEFKLILPYRLASVDRKSDRVFPFEATNEAMAYVEKGRAKGKVVVKVK